MTDRGCCSPVRERIDDGGVEPRWRRPTGKEMGTLLCSLSAAATRSTKEWVWGWKEMPPPGARRAPRGSAAAMRRVVAGSHLSSVTMLQIKERVDCISIDRGPLGYIYKRPPNPRH